jgi:hypothetical protein
MFCKLYRDWNRALIWVVAFGILLLILPACTDSVPSNGKSLTENQRKNLEKKLSRQWNGFLDALAANNLPKALKCFATTSRPNYEAAFKSIISSRENVSFTEQLRGHPHIEEFYGTSLNSNVQDDQGNPVKVKGEYSLDVRFVREDFTWKIANF